MASQRSTRGIFGSRFGGDQGNRPPFPANSPKARLGSKDCLSGVPATTGIAQKMMKRTSPTAAQASTGSPRMPPALARAPGPLSTTIAEPSGSKWPQCPQYLNSLKNVVVEDSGSQYFSTIGHNSNTSIKKPLASAKKANIAGLARGYPGRGRAAAGSGHQNFANRYSRYKQPAGQGAPQTHARGMKQLRSDSPRHQDHNNQLKSKQDIFNRIICETQISAVSGGGSTSPNSRHQNQVLRADGKSGHSNGHQI